MCIRDRTFPLQIIIQEIEHHIRIIHRLPDTFFGKTVIIVPGFHHPDNIIAVSYTHLDVYKRQRQIRLLDRQDTKDLPIVAMSANAFAEDVRLRDVYKRQITSRAFLDAVNRAYSAFAGTDGVTGATTANTNDCLLYTSSARKHKEI